MWLNAPNITCKHGFSTRHGGVSTAPFNSLNLGGSQDDPEKIKVNRALALNALQLNTQPFCFLKQVHGSQVHLASGMQQEGDALIAHQAGCTLAISIADCFPILFQDPENGIIGAAHAGWRGTCAGIAAKTVQQMMAKGAQAEKIQVAVGQGICMEHFEVGPEVIAQFKEANFSDDCWSQNKIDLKKCIDFDLFRAGIPTQNIWHMNRCTFEPDFFSYRRDHGITGRMWAVISL